MGFDPLISGVNRKFILDFVCCNIPNIISKSMVIKYYPLPKTRKYSVITGSILFLDNGKNSLLLLASKRGD